MRTSILLACLFIAGCRQETYTHPYLKTIHADSGMMGEVFMKDIISEGGSTVELFSTFDTIWKGGVKFWIAHEVVNPAVDTTHRHFNKISGFKYKNDKQ